MALHKNGRIRLRLISASPNDALRAISQRGIVLRNIKQIDQLTVTFVAQRHDMEMINQTAQRRGERLELLGQQGTCWGIRRLLRRPVLMCGILFVFFLALFLPTRVFFIQVEGNSAVPTRLILEQAAHCGIRFGTSTRQVRSEKMKNALLQSIPQLQWAGINTSVCIAVISVREKTLPETVEPPYPVSSMVAVRDGYITQIAVTAGSAACKTGQSVKAGQLLISAYTDCGLYIRAVKAKGEVFADTCRQISVMMPSRALQVSEITQTKRKYALILGKKQINFSKDSGISGIECDRIKSVHYVTLPGGFRLPIAVSVITELHYETVTTDIAGPDASDTLFDTAHRQLLGTMVAGKILHAKETVTAMDGVHLLEGSYQCNEMIGVSRTEEIMKQYE